VTSQEMYKHTEEKTEKDLHTSIKFQKVKS